VRPGLGRFTDANDDSTKPTEESEGFVDGIMGVAVVAMATALELVVGVLSPHVNEV
jgi:hypothetical protein